MIAVRRYAEFHADFPDDHVWNEDETDTVQTGGKAVAQAIAQILVGLGCTIHELEDNVGHCWECSFSYKGSGLRFQVVDLEPCIFILEEPRRGRPDYGLHLHLLLELNEGLRRDGRFHDLAWYDYDGLNRGEEAFEVPVIGDLSAPDEIKKEPSFLAKLLAPLKARPENR